MARMSSASNDDDLSKDTPPLNIVAKPAHLGVVERTV